MARWPGGRVVLVETVRGTGLEAKVKGSLGRWRKDGAVHDPAKVVLDLVVSLALGGDCLADVALVP